MLFESSFLHDRQIALASSSRLESADNKSNFTGIKFLSLWQH